MLHVNFDLKRISFDLIKYLSKTVNFWGGNYSFRLADQLINYLLDY